MAADDSEFQKLLGVFSYAQPSLSPQRSISTSSTTSTTKRRRIELADASTVPLTSRKSGKSTKSPTKKAPTITERATAAYQVKPKQPEATASKFFAESNTAADHNDRPAAEEQTKKKKPRKSRKTAKPVPEIPPLYSPQHAHAQALQQQFLFGTSSQLAADESPTFINETLAAIRDSETTILPTQAAVSPSKKSSTKVPTAPHGTNLSVDQAEKELWCSAARDFKGGLHRDNSGLIAKKRATATSAASGQSLASRLHMHTKDNGRKTTMMPPPATRTAEAADDGWTVLPSSSPINMIPPPTKMPLQPKDGNARQNTSTSPEKPQRKRGRPPKQRAITPAAEDTFINIDDISDPEAPATPSPPRKRASASPRPSPTLDLSPIKLPTTTNTTTTSTTAVTDILTATAALKREDAQWTTVQASIFPQITTAVKSITRTTDPEKPTWHQKMLLYDPIVLEDYTAWLNDQGLRISVQRRKVKGRKKKGGEAPEEGQGVGVVQEPLQAWMVQRWCEERSVCCLWKEGLRGGVRTRY